MSAALLRAAARILGLAALTLVLLQAWVLVAPTGAAPRRMMRRLWCRGVLFLLGIKVSREGRPFRACPTVFVPNHVSYLDIPILGADLDATFIAKEEVRGWPLLGLLARITGTMFVLRHWRFARLQRDTLASRLRRGEFFVLFAEGTSTNGLDVLPLKTSLLSVAEPGILDRPIAVQPVTIAYRRLADGTPIDAGNTGIYAWWGEATLLPHLWRLLQQPGAEVLVRIGEPVLSWSVTCRKRLARALHLELRAGIRGRDAPPAAPGADLPQARGVLPGPDKRKEACASFSDRTCVCGLMPLYEQPFRPATCSRQDYELANITVSSQLSVF